MSPFKFCIAASISGCLGFSLALPVLAQIIPVQEPTAQDQIEQTIEEQPESPEEYLQRVLGLSDEQTTAIRTIFETYQPSIETAASEYVESLDRLNNLIAPTVASEAIRRARAETIQKELAVYDLLFERNLEIRDVLTVEQRAEVSTFLRSLLDLEEIEPTVAFPDSLIGMNINDAIAELEADGWTVSARSPGSVFLDRQGQQLDIDHNPSGAIENIYLR